MKAYIPHLHDGEKLLNSKGDSELFRGLSIDEDNNHGIPELEEIDLDDYIPKDSLFDIEKEMERQLRAELYLENQEEDLLSVQNEDSDDNSAIYGVVAIAALIAGISAYVASNPEMVDKVKTHASEAIDNIKGYFSKIKEKFKNRPRTELVYDSSHTLGFFGFYFEREKPPTNEMTVCENKAESSNREEMSLEDAQVLLLKTLINYIGFKNGVKRLSNATVNGKEVDLIDIENVLKLSDELVQKYPALMDDKTKTLALAALNENDSAEENKRIAELLGIDLDGF